MDMCSWTASMPGGGKGSTKTLGCTMSEISQGGVREGNFVANYAPNLHKIAGAGCAKLSQIGAIIYQNSPDRGQRRKIRFSKFPGSELKKIQCTLCFVVFPRKMTKSSQNPGLVNLSSATPWGQLNWTGPIANSSDIRNQCRTNLLEEGKRPPPPRFQPY